MSMKFLPDIELSKAAGMRLKYRILFFNVFLLSG